MTAATIAAGSSATLDADQVTSGKRAHLLQLVAAASVPFKVEVRTVSNGVPSAPLLVGFGAAGRDWQWTAVARGFITVDQDAGAGFDGFRVVMTNLDTTEAADLYTTFFYDEVDP